MPVCLHYYTISHNPWRATSTKQMSSKLTLACYNAPTKNFKNIQNQGQMLSGQNAPLKIGLSRAVLGQTGDLITISSQNLPDLPGCNLKPAPHKQDRRKPKKGTAHSRLVGGSCIEQENLFMRLALGGSKTSSFWICPPSLESYRGPT